jgi:hypothetical protein
MLGVFTDTMVVHGTGCYHVTISLFFTCLYRYKNQLFVNKRADNPCLVLAAHIRTAVDCGTDSGCHDDILFAIRLGQCTH